MRFDEVNVELEPYHSEEGADQTEWSEHRDDDVDLFVLLFREEWILTLDSTSLHLAVPALHIIRFHQWRVASTSCVKRDFFFLIRVLLKCIYSIPCDRLFST